MSGNKQPAFNPVTDGERLWDLASHYDPELLLSYLTYVEGQGATGPISRTQRSPVGFDSFPAAIELGPDGKTERAMRVNFYTNRINDPHITETFHAHAQNATATLYGPEGSFQVIERVRRLPDGVNIPSRTAVLEGMTSYVNQLVSNGPGNRPEYHIRRLSKVGGASLQVMSISQAPNGTTTTFNGPEVHRVSVVYSGDDQVFTSVHLKERTEPPELSEYDGLVQIKGVLPDEAGMIGAIRAEMLAENPSRTLGPATMIYGDRNYNPIVLDDLPPQTSSIKAQDLLRGSIATLRDICR